MVIPVFKISKQLILPTKVLVFIPSKLKEVSWRMATTVVVGGANYTYHFYETDRLPSIDSILIYQQMYETDGGKAIQHNVNQMIPLPMQCPSNKLLSYPIITLCIARNRNPICNWRFAITVKVDRMSVNVYVNTNVTQIPVIPFIRAASDDETENITTDR